MYFDSFWKRVEGRRKRRDIQCVVLGAILWLLVTKAIILSDLAVLSNGELLPILEACSITGTFPHRDPASFLRRGHSRLPVHYESSEDPSVFFWFLKP